MLLEARRNSDGRIEYVVCFAGPFESAWVQWLCEASLESLGLVFPTVTFSNIKYTLQLPLGSGQYSHGYELRLGEDTVVVKQFSDLNMADHERTICKAFEKVSGATRLFATQPVDPLFVAVTPKGLPFDSAARRITVDHVNSLIKSLGEVHTLGYCHGDICSSNIYFLDGDQNALLNDWSHVRAESTEDERDKDWVALSAAIKSVGGSQDLQDSATEMRSRFKKRQRIE